MYELSIKDFTKKYCNKVIAAQNLNLDIAKNRLFGLIGPNGAGKTTTINFIAGTIKQDQGELYLFGEKISKDCSKYKRHIGFLLENPLYFEKLTGIEYLHFCGQMHQLPGEQIKSRADELIELFDLKNKKDKYIETYSKGMKKQISLSAAILHAPELLILDEPFEGIDPVSAKIIMHNLLVMKKKGKTILITSHILSIIEKLCDEVAILDKGQIVFRGMMETIQAQTNGKFREQSDSGLESIYDQYVDSSKEPNTLSWL